MLGTTPMPWDCFYTVSIKFLFSTELNCTVIHFPSQREEQKLSIHMRMFLAFLIIQMVIMMPTPCPMDSKKVHMWAPDPLQMTNLLKFWGWWWCLLTLPGHWYGQKDSKKGSYIELAWLKANLQTINHSSLFLDALFIFLYFKLEGMAAYGHLLLAPVEGWWSLATCRALWALLSFRCLGFLQALIKVDGISLEESRIKKKKKKLT